ncbi:MAG TPA: tetratricopeptide repeat protein [Bryobacteraceae bacterium]|jgi:tetratricopeptide (TPR) repeat protein|nr:tetratricopeptide repeat protein [Bryobacteraceae bacterium]
MIAALLFLIAFQVTPELRQHVEAGLKAKASGDLETAVREFGLVAGMAPGLAPVWVNLGSVYLARKDYADAIPALRKALEINSDLPGAQEMLGAALLAQGFAAEAVPHLEKAQADDLLGLALLESGRPRDAVEHLEAALLKRPGDPDLLYYLGQAHIRLSTDAFESIRRNSPQSARAEQLLAEEMRNSGNAQAAEQHFRAALALRPDLRGIHYALGDLYLSSGDYEKAETEFRAETQIAPGSAAAAWKLGSVLLNRGRVADGISELKRADTLQPAMPETLLELGKAYNTAGNAAAAEKCMKQVITLEETGSLAQAAHFQLALIYRKLKRDADAERELSLFREMRRQSESSSKP